MNNGMVRSNKGAPAQGMDFTTFTGMLLDDCMPFVEKKYRVKGDKWSRAMAGLSMGSMQTSMTHPELFGWLGLFSGFMRKLGGDESHYSEAQSHLRALNDLEQFKKNYKLFFRAMGTGDAYWKSFAEDDEFCKEIGADPENLDIHIRKTYSGIHDWNVWRICIHDFAQLIFKD